MDETLRMIERQQHEKPSRTLTKDLLRKLQASLRIRGSQAALTPTIVSVSSLDPIYAGIDFAKQRDAIDALLRATYPELSFTVRYHYCWWGASSGDLITLCGVHRPRHAIIVSVVL